MLLSIMSFLYAWIMKAAPNKYAWLGGLLILPIHKISPITIMPHVF